MDKLSGLLFILSDDDRDAYEEIVQALGDAVGEPEILWAQITEYVLASFLDGIKGNHEFKKQVILKFAEQYPIAE
jgi:hypothetical protein